MAFGAGRRRVAVGADEAAARILLPTDFVGRAELDGSQTISEIVRQHEETRSVFLRAGLRLADVGSLSLDSACTTLGIERASLMRQLAHAIEESAPFAHGAFELDLSRDTIEVSPAYAELLGMSERTGPAALMFAQIHPDDRGRVERLVAGAAAHPRPLSFECRVIRRDGAIRIHASRMEPLRANSPVFIGMTWDITEQRPIDLTQEPETALPLLHSTLEATEDGVLVVDRTGNVTLYNQRFLSLWRIPNEVVAKGTDEALLVQVLDQLSEPQAFLQRVRTLYASPERESFDTIRFKDGRVFERYSRAQRVDFAIVGRVWSFRDVTERERLLAQMSFMADAMRLLGSLAITSALDAISKVALPFLGDACAIDVFGDRPPHPTVSHSLDPNRPFAPVLRPEVRAGTPAMYDTDGRSEIAAPLRTKDRVIGTIVVSAPMERRHSRADFELVQRLASYVATAVENARLLEETTEALQTRDEFLAIAAHELRGPLSAIHMAVETLGRSDLPPPIRDKMLAVVEREDRRLTRFAADITDITRIRAGVLAFHDEDVDLVSIVREVVSRMAIEIERSGTAVSVEATDPVIGRWDRGRLDQVVTNLLDNALKFGLGKPIELSVDANEGWATLTVTDHGLGVAEAQRETIFEPFARAVSVRHYGGLGLGLFIVRTIVTHYAGTAVVEPIPGDGSRFVVRLPQAKQT